MNSELSLAAYITKYFHVLSDGQSDQNLTIDLVTKNGNVTRVSKVCINNTLDQPRH